METVDRIQYAHSIDTGGIDYSNAFTTYFDQLMGLYGFIQPCNYTISIVDTSSNSLTLDIKFNDGESATLITNILTNSDRKMEVYNKVFILNSLTTVNLNTLRMTLITEQ